MRTLKLTLAYDGSAYAGWQLQSGQQTVQGALEAAILKVTRQETRTVACGRTDAGVHALGQVVSFDTTATLTAAQFLRALNAELPADIAVVDACEVRPGFHAIRDCVHKRYRYVIDDGPVRDLFQRHFAWHCRQQLQVPAMREAAEALHGTHDFRSFESHWPNRESSVRTVYEIDIHRAAGHAHRIEFEISADGFLYNMVRAIVGTLVEVGRGAQPPSWPAQVLAAQDRRLAGPTAPAHGLFLLRAEYRPESLRLPDPPAAVAPAGPA